MHPVERVQAALDARRTRRTGHSAQFEVGGDHPADDTPAGYMVSDRRRALRSRAEPTTASTPATVANSRTNSNIRGW
jgi:hypothetical protein